VRRARPARDRIPFAFTRMRALALAGTHLCG
jgi:hypothetical protein